jgi:hypothetical protein
MMPRDQFSWFVSPQRVAAHLCVLVFLVVQLAGCREATEVDVEISTDVLCRDVSGTTISVGAIVELEGIPPRTSTFDCAGDGRIGSITVVPKDEKDVDFGIRVVTGVGKDPNQCVRDGYTGGCIVARRLVSFIPHRRIVLPVLMEIDCRDIPCGVVDTCRSGGCVPARVADPLSCGDPAGCGNIASVDASAEAGPDASAEAGPDAAECNTPYGGTARAITSVIQAEDFDSGSTGTPPGEGCSYHDTTPTNEGNAYRTTEGVDIEGCGDTGGGRDVCYTAAGEWMKYTANVAADGLYTFQFRVAAPAAVTGAFHLEDYRGTNLTGAMTVPATGGYQTWQTVTKTDVALTAGTHVLKFVVDYGPQSNASWNFNWFTAVKQ